MEITEIRISLRSDNKLKAFASITLDNMLVIRGLKIIEGAKGVFVAMPSRKRPDGTFQDIAHPINNDTRAWMESKVIGAYNKEKEKMAAEAGIEALKD
jgi:stage V sporulation protein G